MNKPASAMLMESVAAAFPTRIRGNMRAGSLNSFPGQAWAMIEMHASSDDTISLDAIFVHVEFREQGIGNLTMRWLFKLADMYQCRIVGHVSPFGAFTMGRKDLRAWYKRLGFHVSRNGLITRSPKQERS